MRILLIAILTSLSFTAFGQWYDSIQASDVTGADTAIQFSFYSKDPVSLQFEWTNLDTTNATLLVGMANMEGIYVNADTSKYPLTLTDTIAVNVEQSAFNGDTAYTHILYRDNWPAKDVVIKLDFNDVSTGAVKWRIRK